MNEISPNVIKSEQELLEVMTRPNSLLIDSIDQLSGDILLLGAGGKMGYSLAMMIKRAAEKTEKNISIKAVSRFSDSTVVELFLSSGIEIIKCDLTDESQLSLLPKDENIIYMVGQKFGSSENQSLTWGVNTYLIGRVSEIFKDSKIVLFSTGNVYPFSDIDSKGPDEKSETGPIGEYAQSALGRERVFEYMCQKNGTNGIIFRLNYAIDLRYGVLYDLAEKVFNEKNIPLNMGYFNCIWQGDANMIAALSLNEVSSPPNKINVTGMDVHSVRKTAEWFGNYFNKKISFSGKEEKSALLSNAQLSYNKFLFERVSFEQMLEWTAHWVMAGNPSLNKPTHFEERAGNF
ncbi:MAG: NAD-dependent epimerase/dehydratase family protein [Candidatus Neomarinimicrobiota bacterium]